MKIFGRHDIERTYGSNKGAIYGVVADKKKNKGFKFLNKVNTLIIYSLLEDLLILVAVCRW